MLCKVLSPLPGIGKSYIYGCAKAQIRQSAHKGYTVVEYCPPRQISYAQSWHRINLVKSDSLVPKICTCALFEGDFDSVLECGYCWLLCVSYL